MLLLGSRDVDELFDGITEWFSQRTEASGIPCYSVSMCQNGKIIYHEVFGDKHNRQSKLPWGADPIFVLGSNTKTITTAAILKSIERSHCSGRHVLCLNSLVKDLLPELRTLSPHVFRNLRLVDLICHRSSARQLETNTVMRSRTDADLATALLRTKKHPAMARMLAHEYSHLGMVLIARIVSRVNRMPFERFVERFLLSPFCIRDVYAGVNKIPNPAAQRLVSSIQRDGLALPPQDYGVFNPAYGYCATTRAIARFHNEYILGSMLGPRHKMLVRKMTAPHTKGSFGLGVQVMHGSGPRTGSFRGHNAYIQRFAGITATCPRLGLTVSIFNNAAKVHDQEREAVSHTFPRDLALGLLETIGLVAKEHSLRNKISPMSYLKHLPEICRKPGG